MCTSHVVTLRSQASYVPMDQMRWGSFGSKSVSKRGWDWLVDAIDSTRLDATVRNYPVDDSVDPHTSRTQYWKNDHSASQSRKKLQSASSYSPGFILPLVLAALEDACSSNRDPLRDGPRNTASLPKEPSSLVQRLCDKGAVSMSLMGLCSNCSQLRRISVSIVGLLISFIHSNEAIETGSWRERPQIAMILDSVQRALAIKLQATGDYLSVPRLPGVAAAFLARVSLVLSRPGDPLYPAINRAFLRIQSNHGAFQDLWRLPEFITLLCSSADDPKQVLAERVWALTLLDDGFLDESCYRPLIACHGPALLLTSLSDTRRLLSDGKSSEFGLLVRVLHTIMRRGGKNCETHFIKRIGLLSFLRSFATVGPIHQLLDESSRAAFLLLIELTLEKARKCLSPEDFDAATTGFAGLVVTLSCQSPVSWRNGENDDANKQATLSHAGAILTLLAFAMGQTEIAGESRFAAGMISSDGVTLANASTLLASVAIDELPAVLAALCALPTDCNDGREATSFSLQILHQSKRISGDANFALIHAMHKISTLACFFRETFDKENIILRLLLEQRQVFAGNGRLLTAWNECIERLVGPEKVVEKETACKVIAWKLTRPRGRS